MWLKATCSLSGSHTPCTMTSGQGRYWSPKNSLAWEALGPHPLLPVSSGSWVRGGRGLGWAWSRGWTAPSTHTWTRWQASPSDAVERDSVPIGNPSSRRDWSPGLSVWWTPRPDRDQSRPRQRNQRTGSWVCSPEQCPPGSGVSQFRTGWASESWKTTADLCGKPSSIPLTVWPHLTSLSLSSHLSSGNNNIHLKMLINNNNSYQSLASTLLCAGVLHHLLWASKQSFHYAFLLLFYNGGNWSSERVVNSPKAHSWEESELNWTQICWF